MHRVQSEFGASETGNSRSFADKSYAQAFAGSAPATSGQSNATSSPDINRSHSRNCKPRARITTIQSRYTRTNQQRIEIVAEGGRKCETRPHRGRMEAAVAERAAAQTRSSVSRTPPRAGSALC